MKTLQKTLVLALVLASGLGCENRARAEYPVLHNGQVVSEYQVAKPNKAPDEFEPNSKRDMALQIFTNQTQLHTINPDGDEDWIMFVPDQSGRYVLELTDATIDLEGELWAQSGKDREKRLEKFKLPRGRTAALQVDVTPNVGYFKVRVEAEDNDDIGAYRISARQLTASGPEQPNVRRPDVFESDNDPEIAIGIEDDVTQLHTIYPRDDEDWMVYAPQQPGEYLLKISNVTADLKGELWVQRGDDKERRVDKFDVSRWGRTISLRADGAVRYFKIRLEADDNDDTGDYSVAVVRKAPTVIR
ncbi:MAG: hypothetical protein HN350_22410, partial [Phycisphaerales bacterium]|nr:hypothetical protein [Phycisphaerales bacterium]